MWAEWRQLLTGPEVDELEIARLAATFGRYFDRVKTEAVRVARASGRSWDEVAQAIGTTRQSAWERYRREERARRMVSDLLAAGDEV